MALDFSDAEENQTGDFNDGVNYFDVGEDLRLAMEKRKITLDPEVVEDVLIEVRAIRSGGYYDE